mgnify:CR=1 FL=1
MTQKPTPELTKPEVILATIVRSNEYLKGLKGVGTTEGRARLIAAAAIGSTDKPEGHFKSIEELSDDLTKHTVPYVYAAAMLDKDKKNPFLSRDEQREYKIATIKLHHILRDIYDAYPEIEEDKII